MSSLMGGETPPPSIKTLGRNGLYLDRCVIGEAALSMYTELVQETASIPGVELNIPHSDAKKQMSINVVSGQDIKEQKLYIGHLAKQETVEALEESIPELSEYISGSRLFFTEPHYGPDGAVYFEFYPDKTTEKLIRYEQERSWYELAKMAGIDLSYLLPERGFIDCRVAYLDPNAPKVVGAKFKHLLKKYDGVEVDLLAALPLNRSKRARPDKTDTPES